MYNFYILHNLLLLVYYFTLIQISMDRKFSIPKLIFLHSIPYRQLISGHCSCRRTHKIFFFHCVRIR